MNKKTINTIIIITVLILSNIVVIKKYFYKPSINNEVVVTNTTIKVTEKIKTTKKKTTKKVTKKVTKVKTSGKEEYINYAVSYGNYDEQQTSCLINLWNRESGWNPASYNKSSGACGIPQALPCSKIKNSEGSNDWKAQIRWGVKYINARYKTPCKAWNHFQKKHWY